MASGSKTSGCTAAECCPVVPEPQKYICKDPLDYKGNSAVIPAGITGQSASTCQEALYFFDMYKVGFTSMDFSKNIEATICTPLKTYAVCSCENAAATGLKTTWLQSTGYIDTAAALANEAGCQNACNPNDASQATFEVGCDPQSSCKAQLDDIATYCCTSKESFCVASAVNAPSPSAPAGTSAPSPAGELDSDGGSKSILKIVTVISTFIVFIHLM